MIINISIQRLLVRVYNLIYSLAGATAMVYFEPYTVNSFTFSDRDTNFSLTAMFCGLRIYVDIFAGNLQRSTKRPDEYLQFLKVADAHELDGLTIEDPYDWVLEGCSSTSNVSEWQHEDYLI